MNIPIASQADLAAASFDAGRDDLVYQSDQTLVFRRHLPEGAGSIICKEPLGPGAQERLRHERRILRRLAGIAGVPRLTDMPSPDNAIAVEDGNCVALAQAVRAKRPETPELLTIALQLARIAADMHRAGVVHKDINPANIMVCGVEKRPMLIDFDLATTFAEERPSFIPVNEIAGTLAYLAPELTGRTGRAVDQRADLYALGATLYELSVGHPPFESADPLQLIHDHLARMPTPPDELKPAIPPGLSAIIMHLLEKEPDRRYQSAEGLAHDLMRLREALVLGERGTFPLGERDFPSRLRPPSRLVGRASEIGMLHTAFDDALNGVGCILVAGAPGVGKSALINELRSIVAARHGWFVGGKFDQYRHDAPSATRQALCAVGRLLLAEPEAELARQRARILEALGPNAALVTAVSAEFIVLLGPQPGLTGIDPIELERRGQQALVDLLGAIVSPSRPLVMVLDDLQWAKAPSIRAIEGVLTADKLRGLLLVGAYRENEVDAAHPLAAVLPRWAQLDTAPRLLRLENLPPADLGILLSEMLQLPPTEAIKLADAVGAHTGGNPYDTIELINALRHDGALTLEEEGWRWDADAIRRYVGKGEVVDLLAARIARLPAAGQRLLEIMACIGGEVEIPLLQAASSLSETALEEQIAPSLEDGLLIMERSDQINVAGTLRFRHDRVQQAAYGRLDVAQRQAAHLAIARRLSDLPEYRTVAAEQYPPAMGLIHDAAECRAVVALLHDAALKARQKMNYNAMEHSLTAALALLNSVESETDGELRTALEIELHAALYTLGRLDEADAVYRSIAGRGLDPVTLADPGSIQINSLTNRGRLPDALALGLELLRQLGLAAPELGATNVAQQLAILNQWVAEDRWEVDQQRPEISDPRVVATARLINRMMPPASFCDLKSMLWLIVESRCLWVEYGPCAALVASLSCSAVAVIALGQEFRCGYEIVRHVLAIGEARDYEPETSQARFLYTVSAGHWFKALEEDIPQAQRAHEGLVRGGDLQMACWNYYPSLTATLDCGPTLENYASEVNAALAFAARTGNDYANATFLGYRQLLRALRGETNAPGSFSDGDFDEEDYFSKLADNTLAGGFSHLNRALAAAVFDDKEALALHAVAAKSLLVYIGHHYSAALSHLLHALALAQRIAAAPEQRAALLTEFDECRDWLARRAADAPMNFMHLLKWVEAERAWAKNDLWDAASAFDAALREVAPRSRPWHQALITERAGLFHLRQGLAHTGRILLTEARRLYEAWGAGAKARQLESHHAFLRAAPALRRKEDRQGGSSGISIDSLDLLGILRASQVLSSETSIGRLKTRVADLLGEMTGATKVLLVLRRDDRQGWFLSASADEEYVAVEEAAARGLLPLSVFRYAERTREPLLVEDALRDERFDRDLYLAGIEQCSVLAVPVLSQGMLRAMLLLENRLSRDAFSADRLDAVMLIAGQLAVSLDNALLYASLEDKVAERTEALKEVNLRLETLSITDPLTGLANRRRFDEVIEAEWQRAIRSKTSIAAAMIDIDYFKLYNDHYGHQGGDECLRRVAKVLSECVRGATDMVARYGGEEFVIVLPGADLDAVRPVAERARAAVEALKEPHEASANGVVTISLGIAAMASTERNNAANLIELADAALYRAKKNGRNRVVEIDTD